jgi:branched-chain amino acid transport system permease protein
MAAAPSSLRRSYLAIGIFAGLYLALGILVRNSYYQLIMTLVLLWATMGLSWNMLSGYSGLISFGHAAFFGLGGYTMTIAFVKFGITPWLGIPLGMGVGVLAGIVIGITTFRLRGHYFALSMLAYPLAMLYVFEWLGYQEVALPMMREAPALYVQFSDQRIYMALALALMVACMVVSLHVERSRFGMSLLAIKQNEAAAEAAGINTRRWKLRAIGISGAIAGGIGGFYAVVLLVVTPPAVFGMLVSAQALTVAMFGGVGTVWGPIIGAAILIPVSETLHAEFGAMLPGIQGVIYGFAIIVVILTAPEGVYWKVRDLLRLRSRAAPQIAPEASDNVTQFAAPRRRGTPDGKVILDVRGLSKSFGGLKAVSDVSFQVREGAILGVIGPNGAGKTTVFNLINGFIRPDAGEVILFGRNMVGAKPHILAERGLGRTFQIMRPFARMTVAENVLVGAYVHAAYQDEAIARARAALRRVGLAESADKMAGGLTTKELRLMEIARALAGRPQILLLDETLAGLGSGEVDEVIAVVRRLAEEGITIVIIEHTMQAMVRLVDRFVVLDHGTVLSEDVPEAVTRDPRVVEAYLGKKWSAAHAQH